jgi:hypothetical protein
MHVPPMHACIPPHAIPQLPQFAFVVRSVSQSGELVSQLPKPVMHA